MPWLTQSWHDLIPAPWATVVLMLVAVLCGAIVGIERARKEKPVGFRTLTLVSLGAAIFTMMSITLGEKHGNPFSIAGQIVSGIGFLGAGVILRGRFGISGLTSAATIWVMAAAGIVIGAGYGGAGLALSLLILAVITVIAALEQQYIGPCQYWTCCISFDPHGGKTTVQLEDILDEYDVRPQDRNVSAGAECDHLHVRYCHMHRSHREFLLRIAEMPQVHEILRGEAAASPTETGT